ncbi:TetR/AcrR family transcriptional regulator [Polynucleobacter sp. 86C-FISCH]|uniref:TetR/AcrR family transcriptional regulator n=1 Tax=Polynucleobacter sp. 86C-FISCH TaxID=2689101 RepID=UPI001C0C60A1|nr:TetR/AcrR family transcriptional regulator [Polynucleobacter sp. 86C-FISCH]MBU3596528.1 TetR/AcrR family transcriptional regulator [Polynucleobacter sp. 86C-FISCH]
MLDTRFTSTALSTESKKGLATKSTILQAALEIASKSGLEGITIGHLADSVGMSKSGVFAHFGSREELQIEVIRKYYQYFADSVFAPALNKPKGLPRLRQMIDSWLKISVGENTSSCFFIAGAAEFDDRPGIVRDELVRSVEDWRSALLRAIKESIAAGHLKKTVVPQEMLFNLYSIVLGAHHDSRFLQNPKSLTLANKLIKNIFLNHQATTK